MIHTCYFCKYVYCACCGEDASSQANHYGYFSDTNCGFDRFGKFTRSIYDEQQNCCVGILKSLAIFLLALILFPFFLAFFAVIITPYVLAGRQSTVGKKVLMVVLGFILGLLFTPFFIVFAVLYTLGWLIYEALNLCGCATCDCFSVGAGGLQNHVNYQN